MRARRVYVRAQHSPVVDFDIELAAQYSFHSVIYAHISNELS